MTIDKLTKAELEVAKQVACGLKNKQIAENLSISQHTVKAHLEHIFAKLNISNRVMLAVKLYISKQNE